MRRRESLLDSNYSFETRPEQFSIEEQPLPSYEYDRDCLIPRLKVFAKKFHIEMPRKWFNFESLKWRVLLKVREPNQTLFQSDRSE